MFTETEKKWIKNLGQLYVKGSVVLNEEKKENVYRPVDLFEYFKKCQYDEDLDTYMKYRNSPRYEKSMTCGGSIYYYGSDRGTYVKNNHGSYINIDSIIKNIKMEDVQKRLDALKEKHKNTPKFRWNPNIGGYGSFVPDMENGTHIFDAEKQEFIDISK